VTYRIGKSWTFSAAHHLPQLPPTHQCHRVHGHNYTVEVVLSATRTVDGFVLDYGDMDSWIGTFLKTRLDHRDLNEVLGDTLPTAELLARWLWFALTDIKPKGAYVERVMVRETEKTFAEYVPE
jgi:6-pyruvoyltetrahydropterin/6-carboxytetrahydropterin synthase